MKTPNKETTGHTPGPWRTGDAGQTIFGPPGVLKASPKTIARIPKVSAPCHVSDLDENIANARLIAAAPDLLTKLGEAVDELETLSEESGRSAEYHNFVTHLRNAIQKAKGNL